MEKRQVTKYVVFLAALVVCAGVVWYFSGAAEQPEGNAILAFLGQKAGEWSSTAGEWSSAVGEWSSTAAEWSSVAAKWICRVGRAA